MGHTRKFKSKVKRHPAKPPGDLPSFGTAEAVP